VARVHGVASVDDDILAGTGTGTVRDRRRQARLGTCLRRGRATIAGKLTDALNYGWVTVVEYSSVLRISVGGVSMIPACMAPR
jgi:hypothetical protein